MLTKTWDKEAGSPRPAPESWGSAVGLCKCVCVLLYVYLCEDQHEQTKEVRTCLQDNLVGPHCFRFKTWFQGKKYKLGSGAWEHSKPDIVVID